MSKGNARPHSQTGKLKFLDKFATGQSFPLSVQTLTSGRNFPKYVIFSVCECSLKVASST